MRLRDDDARAAVGPLVAAAAGVLGISPELVMSRNRSQLAVLARAAISHVLYIDRQWTMKAIGRALGRDHASIHHMVVKSERELRSGDRWFGEIVDAVRRTGFAQLGWQREMRPSWAVPRPLAGRRAA
jgi:chromosomal replication initiation ATPase DnaA